jgi:HK97 family phage major capsid protein
MNTSYTVPLFMVALFIGLVPMALHIFDIHARNVGTVAVDAWRQRSSGIARAVAASLAWMRQLWGSRQARVLATVALALLAMHLSAGHAGATVCVAIAGEIAAPTMTEVKEAIEKSNRAFEEFKTTNDQRLAQIAAKGVADPLLEEKLAKINAELDKHTAIADAFAKLEAKVNRMALSGGDGDELKTLTLETRQFNGSLRATAMKTGRQAPAPISIDEYKAYKAAFDTYLRRGDDQMLDAERKAMSVGSDPDGGYTVTPDLSGRIVKKLFETSEIRQIADQQTISTDALEGLRDTDQAGFGWVAETAARPQTSTPQLNKWRVQAQEWYAQPAATQSLLDDSNIDIENWLADKVSDRAARGTNTAFVVGTGVGQPRGFASYTTAATADATRAWGTPEHVATGTSGGYGVNPNGANKLIDLVHKLNANYRKGANWAMNRRVLGTTRQLNDGSGATAGTGNYLWLPALIAGQLSTLLGYPVTEADDMTDLAANSLSVAFGNFKIGYQIVDRIGTRVLRDPFTAKPYVLFYTTGRVGGDLLHFDAIKFLKFI